MGFGFLASAIADSRSGSPPSPSIPDQPAPAAAPSAPSGAGGDYSYSSGSDYSRSYYPGSSASGLPISGFDGPLPPRRMPIYFPPVAPRLNAHVDLPSPAQARRPAPAELALYVNEPFYAPLSTRLVENTLRPEQRQRLDAYLAEKLRLQNELHAQLDLLRNADSTTRERALAALAREQAPRIAALEQEAEDLRGNIVSGKLFQADVAWDSTRDWRLDTRFTSATQAIYAQFQVMRAAAFYQKGFSPAQRRLLREVAMELGDISMTAVKEAEEQPDEPHPLSDQNPLLYFSPETSRVRLPTDLPPDLADKVATYEQKKSELKKELRDTVYRLDATYISLRRQRAFDALAKSQSARLEELENLAEEIRRGLALLPAPTPPSDPPSLPPAMSERLAVFLQDRLLLQKNLLRLITEAGRKVSITQVAYIKESQGHYRLNVVVDPRDQTPEKLKQLNEEFAVYYRDNSARSVVLVEDLARLRRDAAGLLGLNEKATDAQKKIDSFLLEAADVIEARQDWQLYADYRTAVLEPGLSPGQRRLLYDAALVELDLPLPGPEFTSLNGDGGDRRSYGGNRRSRMSMSSVRPSERIDTSNLP